jgi:leucine dehydrogenase
MPNTSMEFFDVVQQYGHEQVIFCSEPVSGLRAIIGIHDTTLGPAIGGTRLWTYKNDQQALEDALRLSRGMTYKAAVSGLNLGGGTAVIIGDPRIHRTEALFRAYGRYIESLGGRYITAEDVGTTEREMEWVQMETQYVTGIAGASGDPSPFTALGVYHGMKACVKYRFGTDSLVGRTVAIQGAGQVATHIAEYLTKEGARVLLTDLYEEKARKLCDVTGAEYVSRGDFYSRECDIFCPAALGGTINAETIPHLRCSIIAGAANNQLKNEKTDAKALADRDILYAPDYVINAGGLMSVASEIDGYSREKAHQKAENIYSILLEIFRRAKEQNILTVQASDILAEERLDTMRRIHKIHVGTPTIRQS